MENKSRKNIAKETTGQVSGLLEEKQPVDLDCSHGTTEGFFMEISRSGLNSTTCINCYLTVLRTSPRNHHFRNGVLHVSSSTVFPWENQPMQWIDKHGNPVEPPETVYGSFRM